MCRPGNPAQWTMQWTGPTAESDRSSAPTDRMAGRHDQLSVGNGRLSATTNAVIDASDQLYTPTGRAVAASGWLTEQAEPRGLQV